MSNTNDAFTRSVALEKALSFWGPDPSAKDEDVLKTAEAFRAFLAGETAEPKPLRPGIPEPAERDGYIYFRFDEIPTILYRVKALAEWEKYGTVQRLNTQRDTEWLSASGSLATKRGISQNEHYERISAREASETISGNVAR